MNHGCPFDLLFIKYSSAEYVVIDLSIRAYTHSRCARLARLTHGSFHEWTTPLLNLTGYVGALPSEGLALPCVFLVSRRHLTGTTRQLDSQPQHAGD